MTKRKVQFKENTFIHKCPKCDNNTQFTINSDYCAEDCCEIWAVCKCGYDPTAEEKALCSRLEDVWGGVDDDNCKNAITYSWNEVLEQLYPEKYDQTSIFIANTIIKGGEG